MDNNILRKLSTGIYFLCTTMERMPVGCIIDSVFRLNENTVIAGVSYSNFTTSCILNTREFTISVASIDCSSVLIDRFGHHSGLDIEKFAEVQYETVMNSMPVITEGTCGYFHCQLENVIDLGTHALLVGHVIDCQTFQDKKAMTKHDYLANPSQLSSSL